MPFDPRNPVGAIQSDYVGRFELPAITTAEIPTNKWGFWKDTTTGELYKVANDAGMLTFVELTGD